MRELGRVAGDDGMHIRLIESRLVVIESDWDARDVRSTYWRYYVNFRSGAVLLLDDGPYPLAGARVHLVPAWVRFTCANREPIEHLYAHFDLVGLPGPLVREAFPRPITLPPDRAQEASAAALAEHLRRGDLPEAALACQFKSAILRALATAIAALPPALADRCQSLAGRSAALGPALERIEAAFTTPIANADLARRCGMSEDHFIKRFRALVGQTPAQHILERRVAAAARQLLMSGDGIADIAERCGFPDRFYFTRAFTKRMGVSPAAYRKAKQA